LLTLRKPITRLFCLSNYSLYVPHALAYCADKIIDCIYTLLCGSDTSLYLTYLYLVALILLFIAFMHSLGLG